MNRYTTEESDWEGYRTIILKDRVSGCSAEFALRGGTLLNFYASGNGKRVNIIDGYQSAEEFELLSGARCCMMAPFSNRIKNGEYSFNGENYKLINPVNASREPIHGLIRTLILKPIEIAVSDEDARLVLFTDEIRPGKFEGYPFSINVYISIIFSQNNLQFKITGENAGDSPAPFGAGWHPYFKTSESGIYDLEIAAPFLKYIGMDGAYIPLPGNEAYRNIDESLELDFRQERKIGTQNVNMCYCEGAKNKDGIIETVINDPINKIKITIGQEEGVMYLYTADDAKYRPRLSMAAEPVQFISNSYNRHELQNKLTIKPGEQSSFKFSVK
ncbi:MAG TPA: aldose 1-epimerase, partial [Ignavibacteriales bacterium]|nr:aldose 1-epimerase [Ignavibacteriales bacterium]